MNTELEKAQPRVIVVGAGYVGLATAAVLAQRRLDCEIVVYDQNVERLAQHCQDLGAGRDPLGEPGLAKALSATFTAKPPDYSSAIVFVCVGTPSKDGTIDCSAVREVVHEALDGGARLVVIRSTVTPRFVLDLLAEIRDGGPWATSHVVVAPEFLREGHAVNDSLYPSRVVVGAEDRAMAEAVYGLLTGIGPTPDPSNLARMPLFYVRQAEAALVKLAANGMLSFRVWFANAVAVACERIPGGDSAPVLEAIGADPRIGNRHLAPGLGVGGPCLPKDARALVNNVYGFERLDDIVRVMDDEPVIAMVERIRHLAPLGAVLICGVGFKPDSPDWRNSPIVELAIHLAADKRAVFLYDHRLPESEREALQAYLTQRCEGDEGTIPLTIQNLDGGFGIDFVVAGMRCSTFAEEIERCCNAGAVLVDPYRLLDREAAERRGFRYLGRGLGPS